MERKIEMLPDFSQTKRLFGRFFQTYARRKARAISPLADVQVRYLHEGRGMKVMRPDQSESNTGMQQLSSVMQIRFDEIPPRVCRSGLGAAGKSRLRLSATQRSTRCWRSLSIPLSRSATAFAASKSLSGVVICIFRSLSRASAFRSVAYDV